MFPLLHFCTLGSLVLCLFAVFRLYASYHRTKDEAVGNFFALFLSLTIYFLLVSLPAFFSNPVLVGKIYILSYIPLFHAPAFFLRSALNMFHLPGSKYVFPFIWVLIIIITTLNILFSSPAQIRIFSSNIYHWGEGTPLWLGILNGVLVGLLAIACSIFFFVGGAQSKEKLVRTRAFLIGSGIALLVVSAVANYVISLLIQANSKWAMFSSIFASFLTLPALSLMLFGVYYAKSEQAA